MKQSSANKLTIAELLQSYVDLEVKLHSAIHSISGTLCGQCPDPCCKTEHCSDAAQCEWLRRVAGVTGKTIHKDSKLDFLSSTGCRLRAGRPMQCTAYICDRLTESIVDPIDSYIYHVFSMLLIYVIRNAKGKTDLLELEDIELLSAVQRRRLAHRIEQAGLCIELALALREGCRNGMAASEALPRMLYLAQCFPFAAKSVQLPDFCRKKR